MGSEPAEPRPPSKGSDLDFEEVIRSLDELDAEIREDAGKEMRERLGRVGKDVPPSLDQHRPAPSSDLISNLPARNPSFTGRNDLVQQLEHHLQPGKPAALIQAQALHGLGGVGKTQIALEYAHRHALDYDVIWWIEAEQPLAIPGQLAALARRLGIAEAMDQAETVDVLFDLLRQRDRWLFIFDNVEDSRDIHRYWPPGGGDVLVTSRNPAWSGIANTVRVDVLKREEAVTFLKQRAGIDDRVATMLAETVGDLPLALEQAAAYLEETGISATEYLELFRERVGELLMLGESTSSERTIATIWTVAIERLRQEAPGAQDLLILCAFLAPHDIPRALLHDNSSALPGLLASVVSDPISYANVVGALRRYSLITATPQTLSVHRLVQVVVRHDLPPDEGRSWARAAVRLISYSFPEQSQEVHAWPAAARLLPHALAATEHAISRDADLATAAGLLDQAGQYLWARAEYGQARTLLERALAIREAQLGPDHPDVVGSLDNLGMVLRSLGDVASARDLLQRALAIREAQLGPDHPDVARSLNNLGLVLYDLGDVASARDLLQRALAIDEAQLGPDHPMTIWSRQRLSTIDSELEG